MKYTKLVITSLAVAAFAVGCKPSEENVVAKDREAAAPQIESVTMETKEAAREMKDYAYAQKSEFVAAMQMQLDDLNKELDQLSARIEKSSDAAKAEAKPKIEALRDQKAKLTRQLDNARDATESTWDDVEAGFKKGYGELKDGLQQARGWVSEKIAP